MRGDGRPDRDETPSGHLRAAGLAGVLGYHLAQAAVTTSAVFRVCVGTPHDLRPVEYTVLRLVLDNPGTSPARLARALAVTKPKITWWVDRLVARQLVIRSASASDGRVQELSATAAGAALAEQATSRLVAGEQAALQGLSAAERAMLLELLQKVAKVARSTVR